MEIFTLLCLLTTKFLVYLEKKKELPTTLLHLFLACNFFLYKSLLRIPSLCWRYSMARFFIDSYMIAQRLTVLVLPEESTKLAESISPQILKTPLPCNFQECDDLPVPSVYPHPQTDTEQKECKNIFMWKKSMDLISFSFSPCHTIWSAYPLCSHPAILIIQW